MINLKDEEINYINKLISRLKYAEFNQYEVNTFANSSIGNKILDKIAVARAKPIEGARQMAEKTWYKRNLF